MLSYYTFMKKRVISAVLILILSVFNVQSAVSRIQPVLKATQGAFSAAQGVPVHKPAFTKITAPSDTFLIGRQPILRHISTAAPISASTIHRIDTEQMRAPFKGFHEAHDYARRRLLDRQSYLEHVHQKIEHELKHINQELADAEHQVAQPISRWHKFRAMIGAESLEQKIQRLKEAKVYYEDQLVQLLAEQAKEAQQLSNLSQDLADREAYLKAFPEMIKLKLENLLLAFEQHRDLNEFSRNFNNLFTHYKETDPITKELFMQAWRDMNGPARLHTIKATIRMQQYPRLMEAE